MEILDTFYETIRQINNRLAELESHHTLYRGPKGPKGDKGDSGSPGRDGKDSTVVEVNTLREERNAFREEPNQFRKELHDLRTAACAEMQKLAADYEQRLSEIFDKEVAAFCELRDRGAEELAKFRETLDVHRKETEALCARRDHASEELAKFRETALVLSAPMKPEKV